MSKVSWIETISPLDAPSELARAFEHCRDSQTGEPAHLLIAHSLNPRAMVRHYDLYRTLLFAESGLTRRQREAVGLVVSTANDCHY